MAFSNFETIQKKSFGPGTVIVDSNQVVKQLIILHEGKVSAVNTKLNHTHGCYQYTIKDNNILAFNSLLGNAKPKFSYLAESSVVISAFPVNGSFHHLIMEKLKLGFMAIRSLWQEIYIGYKLLKKLSIFSAQIRLFIDNTSLAYKFCLADEFPKLETEGGDSISADPVLMTIRAVSGFFEDNGGQYANPITDTWLQIDHSNLTGSNYLFPSQFDMNSFQLYHRILSLPAKLLNTIYETDISILEKFCHNLKQSLDKNIHELHTVLSRINIDLETLLSDDACYADKIERLLHEKKSSIPQNLHQSIDNFSDYFYRNSKSILQHYKSLQRIPYANISESLSLIGKTVIAKEQSKIKEKKILSQKELSKDNYSAGIDGAAVRNKLKGSANRIMTNLKVDIHDVNRALDCLQKLSSLTNPSEDNPQTQKWRRNFSDIYWNVWERAYSKWRSTQGKVSKEIELMLNFGFFDEKFLDDNHLAFIYGQSLEEETFSYPILRGIEWMDKIYKKEEYPSVDSLYQSYFDKLKRDNQKYKWKNEKDVPTVIDIADSRIGYEMNNFFKGCIGLSSGAQRVSLPILNKRQIVLSIEKSFISKKKISDELDKLLAIDYSAFHREVLVNDESLGIKKEFLQKQVYPYFIRVPALGSKAIMWQDTVKYNLKSRARIAIPAFTATDISVLLMQVVGILRWEIVKTSFGFSWNDSSKKSLTSEYTDYSQFYKKNPKISIKVKERLSKEFKRFRSDRDRFVNDYTNWIRYESQGISRLNSYVRFILYKYAPFRKDVRERLRNYVFLTEANKRFINIRNKYIITLKSRYRKYGDNLPPAIKENYDFYTS